MKGLVLDVGLQSDTNISFHILPKSLKTIDNHKRLVLKTLNFATMRLALLSRILEVGVSDIS
jgi:hypothetical protein